MKRERMSEREMRELAAAMNCNVQRKPHGRYGWYTVCRNDTDRIVVQGNGASVTAFFRSPDYRKRTMVAMAAFHETFALRAFPGKTFRISETYSYINDDDKMILVVDVQNGDQWLNFSKGTEVEVLEQIA